MVKRKPCMKKTFSVFLILISTFLSYSQNVKNIKLPNKLTIIPPGTIAINDSLYIDKAPVNNVMYHEFLKSVNTFWNLSMHDSIKKIPTFNLPKKFYSNNSKINKNNELYGKMNLNNNSTLINQITIDNYFNHPKYNYNPVLQISKEQAELFCKWRTDMVMLL